MQRKHQIEAKKEKSLDKEKLGIFSLFFIQEMHACVCVLLVDVRAYQLKLIIYCNFELEPCVVVALG